MRLPCPAQLYSMQSQSRILTSTFPVFGRRILLTRPRAKNNPQKHEGVYFEYEAVDPDAAEELTALQGEKRWQYFGELLSSRRKGGLNPPSIMNYY